MAPLPGMLVSSRILDRLACFHLLNLQWHHVRRRSLAILSCGLVYVSNPRLSGPDFDCYCIFSFLFLFSKENILPKGRNYNSLAESIHTSITHGGLKPQCLLELARMAEIKKAASISQDKWLNWCLLKRPTGVKVGLVPASSSIPWCIAVTEFSWRTPPGLGCCSPAAVLHTVQPFWLCRSFYPGPPVVVGPWLLSCSSSLFPLLVWFSLLAMLSLHSSLHLHPSLYLQ